MAGITRAGVAAEVHEKLDKLATDLSAAESGAKTEGDYTYPLNQALRDCGFASIDEADTCARIRAVLLGTELHVAERLFWRRSVQVSGTQGISSEQRLEWNNLLEILRRRLKDLRGEVADALAAIGRSMDEDAGAGSAAGVVEIDASDDDSQEFVSTVTDTGLPWFEEGYHEVGE